MKSKRIWLVFLAVLFGYPLFNWVINKPLPPTEAELLASRKIDAQKTNELGVRLYIESRMKDPDSVKFGAVFSRGENHVCGLFNAKNSFGGYVGEKGFVADMRTKKVHIQGESSEFKDNWARICADN